MESSFSWKGVSKFVTFKSSALTIACVVSFSALVLHGAMVISNGGRYYEKIADALAVFLVVLFVILMLRRYLRRLFGRSPLVFSLLLFIFLTASNVFYATVILPRIERNSFFVFTLKRLPDRSLFSMMEGRGGDASLVYAFLRREAGGRVLFLPTGSPAVDRGLLMPLSGVSDVREYDQKPDDFIASLGLEWSIYKDPLCDTGFEYARHGEDMILGSVGVLSCR